MTTIEEKNHARISPSGSKRWMTCPGSVRLIDSLNIPYKPSRFAAEGTVAHEVHELALGTKKEASHYVGRTFTADGFKFKVTDEMADAVQVSLDYIHERIADANEMGLRVEIKIEVWCPLDSLGIEGLDGGTSDVILLFWDDKAEGISTPVLVEVEVVDYKHGQGVAVEVKNNTQGLHYALGTILLPELNGHGIPDGITITISQPRAHHPDGRIRSWNINKDYLLNWCDDELIPKANRTHDADAEFVASDDGCRFCDAKGVCPKLLQRTQEVAMLDFAEDKPSMPDLATMSTEQKCLVMDNISMVRSFLIGVEDQIKHEVDAGSKEYEGRYKLVRGTSRRKFIEDATDELTSPLMDHLKRSDIFEEKPRTMTEIERRLKKAIGPKNAKDIMAEVTEKPEGKLVIAPESDKRRAVQPTIVSDFTDLD